MKIRDITVADVLAGKNWRLSKEGLDDCDDLPMEEWGPLTTVRTFAPEDTVVYAGMTVYASGRVEPILCIKEVGYRDYGGSYCEFVEGAWRQLGLVPNPNAEVGQTFIANPLPNDPSFEADDDYRQEHRDTFARHSRARRQ